MKIEANYTLRMSEGELKQLNTWSEEVPDVAQMLMDEGLKEVGH